MTGLLRRDAAPLGSTLSISTNSAAVLDALDGTLCQYPSTLGIGGSLHRVARITHLVVCHQMGV